jgi:WD40 repeat protein
MTTLSEYEKQRLKNMAANKAHLVALGLDKATAAMKVIKKAPIKGAAINKKKKDVVQPRTKSLRQQNCAPDGSQLPDKPEIKPPEPVEMRPARKPSVPLEAAKVSTGATLADDASAFLQRVRGTLARKEKKRVAIDVAAIHVSEDDIAKLVPERIFSMDVHPSASRLLVGAGDTWGRVGLWDVDEQEAPVVTFEPHTRPVSGVRMLPHQLLTCSHDGSVRCLDLGSGAAPSFVELYRAPEDSDGDYASLHGLSRAAGIGDAYAVSRGDGVVVLLDQRLQSASPSTPALQLHDKKVFCADFSPTRPWLLASASLDRTVSIWDLRKVKPSATGKAAGKALATLEHGLSVTSVRFSENGHRLLTTCNDDLLRVFEGGDAAWALHSSVRHNNKTGRYITPFQAEWLRGSDSTFLCGSLDQPRGLDVNDCDGGASYRLDDEDSVSSVLSLVAQHPSLNVMVASNSGGKCFVWR